MVIARNQCPETNGTGANYHISVWPVDEPANIALFNVWRLTSTIYDVCIQCPMEVTVLFERNIRTIFLKQTY